MSEDEEWVKAVHVRAGFDRVIRGIEATSGLAEDFYDLWLPAHRSGNPREERNAAFVHFGHHSWRWPELDRAAALFTTGNWPRGWHGIVEKPYNWDTIALPCKLDLLVGMLGGAAHTARYAADLQEYYVGDGPFRGFYRAGLRTNHPNCPVEQSFIAIYGSAIARGDFNTLPPFFPGNCTGIKTENGERRPR